MKKFFKRLFSLALAICMICATVAFPASSADLLCITDMNISDYSRIYFKGTTNRADHTSYAVGEEIIFNITLWADNGEDTNRDNDVRLCAPYFYYKLRGDDGAYSDGYVDGSSGEAEIRTSLSKPGAVRLEVYPADKNKNLILEAKRSRFSGGAVAGISEITTTFAEPLDFDEFWEEQIAWLDTCAPTLYSIEETASADPNFFNYIVKVNCVGDAWTGTNWTAGILSVPKNVEVGTLKLAMEFQGYGVRSASREAKNNEGFATFTVCAHSIEQCREDSYYNETDIGLKDYGFSAIENADPATSYFRDMILRDIQAARFLLRYFGNGITEDIVNGFDTSEWNGLWDGSTFHSIGTSQGGFQAISVAAFVPEVAYIYANIPWMADVGGNTDESKIQSTFRPEYADGLRYFDTAFMAKRVETPSATIVCGTGDSLCPLTATVSIFNNMNSRSTNLRCVQGLIHDTVDTYLIYDDTQKRAGGTYDYDGICIESTLTGTELDAFNTEFSDAWFKLTNNKVKIFNSISELDIDSEVSAKYVLKIEDIAATADVTADLRSEIAHVRSEASNYTAVGVAYSGTAAELGLSSRAYLALAFDATSNVHLVSFGEVMSASEIALSFSGSVFNSQPKDNISISLVEPNGNESLGVMTADDLEYAVALPISLPYHALKSLDIKQIYSGPADTGKDYGVITLKGKEIDREIYVFDALGVTAKGNDAGADWIIRNEKLYVFANGAINDSEYAWNNYMNGISEIEIADGAVSIGSGAFDVKSGSTVKIPLSVTAMDTNAFCGKTELTVHAFSGSAGADFAIVNGIDFVSTGSNYKMISSVRSLEVFSVVVTTDANIDKLVFENAASGEVYTPISCAYRDNGGTRAWSVALKLLRKGETKVRVFGYSSGSDIASMAFNCDITVE